MKLMWVIATMIVAVALQMTLARYTVGGRWAFDLVLVGVLFAALAIPLTSVILFEILMVVATVFHHANWRIPPALERRLARPRAIAPGSASAA